MIARNACGECGLSSQEDVVPDDLYSRDLSVEDRGQALGSLTSVAAAMDAGQAPADFVPTGPGPELVNQLLQIPGEDSQEWFSHLGSSIPRRSWESL